MIGGSASTALQYARMSVCVTCEAKDSEGKRLYRVEGDRAFCGVPRDLAHLGKLYRDETQDGCGCSLLLKVSKVESECPLNKWPPKETVKAIPEHLKSVPQPTKTITSTGPRKPCGCGKVTKQTNRP
jgi:hypothetical protein